MDGPRTPRITAVILPVHPAKADNACRDDITARRVDGGAADIRAYLVGRIKAAPRIEPAAVIPKMHAVEDEMTGGVDIAARIKVTDTDIIIGAHIAARVIPPDCIADEDAAAALDVVGRIHPPRIIRPLHPIEPEIARRGEAVDGVALPGTPRVAAIIDVEQIARTAKGAQHVAIDIPAPIDIVGRAVQPDMAVGRTQI